MNLINLILNLNSKLLADIYLIGSLKVYIFLVFYIFTILGIQLTVIDVNFIIPHYYY